VALGAHELVIDAWTDRYETWRHKATIKLGAGQDIAVELEEGARLLDEIADTKRAARAREEGRAVNERIAAVLDAAVAERFSEADRAQDLTSTEPRPLWGDRERALFSSWYELFPRSEGGFLRLLDRLPAIAD